MSWGRKSKRNVGPQRNIGEVFRRLEALETRLKLDESEEEPENLANVATVLDPIERLTKALTKQSSKVKVDILILNVSSTQMFF